MDPMKDLLGVIDVLLRILSALGWDLSSYLSPLELRRPNSAEFYSFLSFVICWSLPLFLGSSITRFFLAVLMPGYYKNFAPHYIITRIDRALWALMIVIVNLLTYNTLMSVVLRCCAQFFELNNLLYTGPYFEAADLRVLSIIAQIITWYDYGVEKGKISRLFLQS